MASQIELSANPTDGLCIDDQTLSFSSLIATLKALTDPPSLKQLYSWLQNTSIAADELEPYLGFKERTYWRHLVCRSEAVEMLVLCWQPGQRTVIHDHNGSVGAVLVQQGVLWETMFDFDEQKGLRYHSVSERQAGAVTGADVPDIHQLGNPDVSEQNLVTIHVYSPPLGVLHTYKPGSAQIELYTPDDSAA